MTITSLYRDYFQKSSTFLYPVLDIKRGAAVTPVNSYVIWKDHVGLEQKKLVCLYHLRDDKEYFEFEKTKLLGNKYFSDFKEVEDKQGVYIFDMGLIESDWDNFVKGKYSLLSPSLKRKIRGFYGVNDVNYAYIDSFLDPSKYYGIYSQLLGESVEVLMKVGELCSPPDLERESLNAKVKGLKLNNIEI